MRIYLPSLRTQAAARSEPWAEAALGGWETVLVVNDEAGVHKLSVERLALKVCSSRAMRTTWSHTIKF